MKAVKFMKRSGISSLTQRVSRRLVNKLVLFFTSLIVLIIGSLSVISYKMIQHESVNNSVESTSNNLLLVGKNLESFLSGIELLSLPQIQYDQFINAVLTEETDYSARLYLEQYLRNLYYSRRDIQAIHLYLVNEQKTYALTREQYDVTVRSASDSTVPQQAWYKQTLESSTNSSFQSFVLPSGEKSRDEQGQQDSFMAYNRVLRSIATRQPQVVLSFYFNTKAKDEIMKDIPFTDGEHLMLLDPDNRPFHLDDATYFENVGRRVLTDKLGAKSGQVTWKEGNQKYLVVYNVGERYGWKLVKPVPYSIVYETATRTWKLSMLIGLILLGAGVIMVVFISGAITRPLQKLAYQMRRFSEGDFEAEAKVKGKDEIAFLTRHFNQMVQQTGELINERYKMKLTEKNAILKALEAEINPHFLYNALQAISTKALKNGMYEICDMVEALALTLRYCISGKDIVIAQEELDHVNRYLSLQKARFGSRLQVETEWAEPLRQVHIPKLSLQTLVENSIKHGLEKVSASVLIEIKVELSAQYIIISVRDNGPGIPETRLREVRRSLEKDWEEQRGDSIGIKNLNTRLKLLYGDEAGLEIESSADGTLMSMRIPTNDLA